MNKQTLLSIKANYLSIAADIRSHKKRMAFEEYNAGRLRVIINITHYNDSDIDKLITDSDEYCYIYNKSDEFWLETITYLSDTSKSENLDNDIYKGMCIALADMENMYNSLVKQYRDNASVVYKKENLGLEK